MVIWPTHNTKAAQQRDQRRRYGREPRRRWDREPIEERDVFPHW